MSASLQHFSGFLKNAFLKRFRFQDAGAGAKAENPLQELRFLMGSQRDQKAFAGLGDVGRVVGHTFANPWIDVLVEEHARSVCPVEERM